MLDINDPKMRAEIEANERALAEAMRTLRQMKEFELFLNKLNDFLEYTKEKIMAVKEYEDMRLLQTYYQVLNNFIDLANYEDPNKGYTATTKQL